MDVRLVLAITNYSDFTLSLIMVMYKAGRRTFFVKKLIIETKLF